MKTLVLVPLDSTYVNPEEIAAISPDAYDSNQTVVTLRGNQCAILVKWPITEVIERLQKHFLPPYELSPEIDKAVGIVQDLAPYFDGYAPTTLAAAVNSLVQTIQSNKAHE